MNKNSRELGIDINKIIAYGDSAGGCLVASLTQMVKDMSNNKLCGQMLVYPTVDNSFEFTSMKEIRYAVWKAKSSVGIWNLYLKNGVGDYGKYAVPLKCNDFTNLPKAYVEPAEIDCLRDEGIEYAKILQISGVETELNITEGAYHGFDGDRESPLVKRILKYRCKVMQEMFK